jgi:CHASE2 domain-containing sensor protein
VAGGRNRAVVLVAALAAALVALCAQQLHVLDRIEDDTIGLRFHVRGEQEHKDVTVVGIDDETFSALNKRWPFPRRLHAEAIDELRRAGARAVVYDVQFTEKTTEAQDWALYEAVGRFPGMVLATTETDGRGGTRVLGGEENLEDVHARAGAANLTTESGGVIRRFPYSVGGLPTLAVAAAEQVSGRAVSPAAFEAGDAWIDYAGPPGAIPHVAFSDLVDERMRADPSLLRDRIVVVGMTAPTQQDVHATPLSSSRLMSGPEVQANAISTALRGFPLRSAPDWIGMVVLFALALAPAVARFRLSAFAAAAAGPVAALAYLGGAQIAFGEGLILPVANPLLAAALGTVATIAVALTAERRERGRVAQRNDLLERAVHERTRQLRDTQLEIIRRLAQASEFRDGDTGAHIDRISGLCHRLALEAGRPEAEAELIGHASAMHDVGKIGIPDRVLLKPGRLDADEWALMKTHTTIGAAILGGSNSELLQLAEQIALTHHERWDGTGYPAGLRGEAIPLAARICSICDVYDALVSFRPYKPRWTHDEALEEIARQRGRQFDPELVSAFLNIAGELSVEGLRAA